MEGRKHAKIKDKNFLYQPLISLMGNINTCYTCEEYTCSYHSQTNNANVLVYFDS